MKKAKPTTRQRTAPRTETTDPIFAVLDAERRADAAVIAVDGNIPDELTDQHYAALSVVIRTRPTTLAGLAALTAWTRDRADWLLANGTVMDGEDLCTLTASIADATAALVKKGAVLCGDMRMLEVEVARGVPASAPLA